MGLLPEDIEIVACPYPLLRIFKTSSMTSSLPLLLAVLCRLAEGTGRLATQERRRQMETRPLTDPESSISDEDEKLSVVASPKRREFATHWRDAIETVRQRMAKKN